jgi:hypothetical protein
MAEPWDIDWDGAAPRRAGPGPDDLQIPPEVQAQRDATRLQMLRAERLQVASSDPAASALDTEIGYEERGIDFTGKPKAAPAAAPMPWEMDWGKESSSARAPWDMPWSDEKPVSPKDNPDFQDLKGPEVLGDAGFQFARGMGEAGAKAAKGVNLALSTVPVAIDAIKSMATGKTATDFEDWWFTHMVRPVEQSQQELGVAKDASFGEKMAHGFGSLTETLAQVIATTPAVQALPATELANLTASRIVSNASDHAARAAILPGLEDAADVMQRVYADTGDVQKAAQAGAATYVTTAMAFMVPVSAEGSLAQRAATGGAGQAVSGEAGRVMMNAVLPEKEQRPFEPEDVALNAAMGAGMGGALGPRGRAPESLPTEVLSAGNVDDAIAAAQRAVDEPIDLRGAEPQPGETPPASPGEMAAQRYRLAADQAIARMTARMQGESPDELVADATQPEGEAARIAMPNEPQPTAIPPSGDTRSEYAAALEKQQRGELLSGYEKNLLETPPETPALIRPDVYRTRQESPNADQATPAAEDAAPRSVEPAAALDERGPDLQRPPAIAQPEPVAERPAADGDYRAPDAQAIGAANASALRGDEGQVREGRVEGQPGVQRGADEGRADLQRDQEGERATALEQAGGDHRPAAEEVGPKLQDFTTPKGETKTFRSKALAQAYVKQNGRVPRDYSPRQVGRGEWVLSRPERVRSEAQKANDRRLAQRARTALATDDLATLMRKAGGINALELTRDGADPKDIADSMRFGAARKQGGMSLDSAAEVMAAHGYDVYDEHGSIDATKARELLQRVLDGERVYTPEGMEARMEAEHRAREADLEPTHEDLRPVDLDEHDAIDVGLVARAAEIDESAVERLAIQFEYDDADFMRGVQGILDGHAEDQDHEAAHGGQDRAAPQAPEGEAAAGPADREGALARLKAAADVVRNAKPEEFDPRHTQELDAARRGAEAAGASDMDMVNALEGPARRPLGLERRLEILERGQPKEPEARVEPPPVEPEAAARPEAEKETPSQEGVSVSGPGETEKTKPAETVAPERQSEAPPRIPKIDDAPPALLSRVKVEVERLHEGKGIKREQVSAKDALAEVDEEMRAFEKLLECVRSA